MEKSLASLKLNFTPNTLGCYELIPICCFEVKVHSWTEMGWETSDLPSKRSFWRTEVLLCPGEFFREGIKAPRLILFGGGGLWRGLRRAVGEEGAGHPAARASACGAPSTAGATSRAAGASFAEGLSGTPYLVHFGNPLMGPTREVLSIRSAFFRKA